jgi:hypothetical protein
VAKENNRGSINSAQKASKTAKSALNPHEKGSRKGKGKQVEVVAIEDGDAGDGDASNGDASDGDASNGDASDGDASEPVLVLGPKPSTKRKQTETKVETPSLRKLRKRA